MFDIFYWSNLSQVAAPPLVIMAIPPAVSGGRGMKHQLLAEIIVATAFQALFAADIQDRYDFPIGGSKRF